jgi:O-antigen ligase
MPPALALVLTLCFIFFVFWRDLRKSPNESAALWIPLFWFFITGSRAVSEWLSITVGHVSTVSLAASFEDGSPIDRIIFFGLIAAGICVLARRRVQLGQFARQNVWLMVFLTYCLVAVLWSDFPLIAFKRWIKVLGHPIMMLIILTEPNPSQAVGRVLKRCGFLLIPLSLLLCKYYPQYGRAYNYWTGAEYFIGVTTAKNTLGHVCMIFGIFYFWNALQALRMKRGFAKLYELSMSGAFLGMSAYLLKMSSSATSLVTMLLGIITIGVAGLPFVSKRRIGMYFILAIFAFAAADSMFGIYANVVHALGRNLTLTDRTNIWHIVLGLQHNPILGTGFESFWLGERLRAVWSTEEGITEAHNGYLEVYLNLGLVGVTIFAGVLISTYRKIRTDLLRRFEFGRLRLGLLVVIIIYNLTEAAFVSVHFIYAVFFLIAIDYTKLRKLRRRHQLGSAAYHGADRGILLP